jgi:hypothetical protein
MDLRSDIQRAWNEGGTRTVLTRGLKRLLRPALKIGTLVFTECDLRLPMAECRFVPGISIREATFDDARLFDDRRVFMERLKAGHRCFMGIEDSTGKLTNCRWVSTSGVHIPEIRRDLILRPREAYVYDVRTTPEFRRRGIDACTRHYTYSCLRDSGFTKLYAYIHGDNYPSLRASRRYLKPVCRIRYIQLRGYEPFVIGAWRNGFPELVPAKLEAPAFV